MKIVTLTKLSFLFLFVSGVNLAFASSITRTFAVDGPVSLALSTSGGSIEVVKGESDMVEVDFVVRKSGKVVEMSMAELTEHKTVTIHEDGNEISIKVKNKNNSWRNKVSVAFEVRTPRSTSVSLMTSGGGLSVNGLVGNQKMTTSGGGIKLSEIEGDVNASTSGGSIKAANLKGIVDMSTSGGSIKIENVEGILDVATSGGSIKLNNISGEVKAHTSGGSINADFPYVTGPIQLATSGGSIKLNVPDDLGMEVDLRGSGVSMDFENFNGEKKRSSARGHINGGGVSVSCHTSGGGVHLY